MPVVKRYPKEFKRECIEYCDILCGRKILLTLAGMDTFRLWKTWVQIRYPYLALHCLRILGNCGAVSKPAILDYQKKMLLRGV